jgi:hypothetical protein
MSFYFDSKNVTTNSATAKQWDFVKSQRAHYDSTQQSFATMAHLGESQRVANAAAVLPRDTWRDFDTVTKGIMTSDEGGPLLADLLPLAKSVNIGKIVSEYRTRSDSGASQASISGQLAKGLDKGVYDYDGGLVLIHDSSFGREWREVEGQRSEGFDGLTDDQSNATRAVTRGIVSHIVNGVADVTFKGYQAHGIKTSANVASLDLSVDLTAAATTYAQVEAVFIAALKQQQADNFVKTPLTVYVSSGIWFNLLRRGTNDSSMETFLDGLRRLPGIASIKLINDTSVLSGNEFFMIPLSSEHIQPVIGMAVTTTPIQRLHPFADFNFVTWGAAGILIKADYSGKKGVLWAREIA